MDLLKNYSKYLQASKINLNSAAYIALSIIISILLFLLSGFILAGFKPLLPNILKDVFNSAQTIIPLLVFVVSLELILAYPYLLTKSKIEEAEQHLPDALKQMADVLKAGGTYELALREASIAEYGFLKEQLQLSLRKLEEGENFENALKTLSQNIDSKLVKRTVNIIIDSIKAGAGLASVLEDIANDARELRNLSRERKSRTLMQTMFIFATAAIVAPFIFGVAASLIKIFVASAKGFEVSIAVLKESLISGKHINFMLELYIFIETLASSAMVSLMRENKLSKILQYFPIMLLVAFLTYFTSRIIITILLIGGI